MFTVGGTAPCFYVQRNGFLYATTGQIGEWEITDNKYFRSADKQVWMHPTGVLANFRDDDYSFVFYSHGNFGIDNEGKIYATEGYLGSFALTKESLHTMDGTDGIQIFPSKSGAFGSSNFPTGGLWTGTAGYGAVSIGRKIHPYYNYNRIGIHCTSGDAGTDDNWKSGVWIDFSGVYRDGKSITAANGAEIDKIWKVLDHVRSPGGYNIKYLYDNNMTGYAMNLIFD